MTCVMRKVRQFVWYWLRVCVDSTGCCLATNACNITYATGLTVYVMPTETDA